MNAAPHVLTRRAVAAVVLAAVLALGGCAAFAPTADEPGAEAAHSRAQRAETRIQASVAQYQAARATPVATPLAMPRILLLSPETHKAILPAIAMLVWHPPELVAVLDMYQVRSTGLNEAEIAFALAHEMAHALLDHVSHLQLLSAPSAGVGGIVVRLAELEADALAVELLHSAGYADLDPLALFVKMRGGRNRLLTKATDTHPSDLERIEQMRRVQARLGPSPASAATPSISP